MTAGAAVAFDVIEELTLCVIGDLFPFDRGGRVGAFEAGGESTGFLMGRAEIAGGVLAGAQRPPRKVARSCGQPASAVVGTFGRVSTRRSAAVARARIVPAFTCGVYVVGPSSTTMT